MLSILSCEREFESTAPFVPLQVPEQDEVFDVHLTGVSGAGSLGTSSTQAQLTVSQNDDPINFRHSFVSVGEGQTAVFVVDRGGQRSGESHVTACSSINI